jgi:hypothetical protein
MFRAVDVPPMSIKVKMCFEITRLEYISPIIQTSTAACPAADSLTLFGRAYVCTHVRLNDAERPYTERLNIYHIYLKTEIDAERLYLFIVKVGVLLRHRRL